jgi:7-carboxy-7-deazaguanine synthase
MVVEGAEECQRRDAVGEGPGRRPGRWWRGGRDGPCLWYNIAMRIAEIFHSLQGEGHLVGTPSAFVRVSGCNLRCAWCDTPYASWEPEGPEMAAAAVADRVLALPARHVVVTGGEPMLFGDLADLITFLHAAGKHITVETAGTLWLEGLPAGGIDLASISPKLRNSTPAHRQGGRFAAAHERQRENLEALERFATGGGGTVRQCQWKFVLAAAEDLAEAEGLLARLNARLPASARISPEHVVLMPEGTDAAVLAERSRWLAELCQQKGYRFTPRLHIMLWGNTRGV